MERDGPDFGPPTQPVQRQPTNGCLESLTLEDKRQKRQSLRVRPSQHFEDAEPLSQLNLSFRSAPPPSTPKMSLFGLFSKPKVEKQRGYVERGLGVPQRLPMKDAAASTPNLVLQVQPQDAPPPRAPTALSSHTSAAKSTSRSKFKDPPSMAPHEYKTGPFEPPPLFQAYPQSMKDGTLELSTLSAETVLQKSKHKKGTVLPGPGADGTAEDAQSFETRRTRSTVRHLASGSSAHVELPRKIFVLVTSGYLLQYSENGPSDRLPEKMLHLGKESAAFACDLLPGKHYVLQVSQAVDQDGILVANSGSIFSKLGIRSAAAKRMTSCFLLVMPNAREMESWMRAIKREIEILGGKKNLPDPAVRPATRDGATKLDELKKTPSHRYQVKRTPSKVSKMTSPTQDSSPGASPSIDGDKSDNDAATIDGIDIEASKLDEIGQEPATRNRTTSDAHSMTSSAAVSVEQHQLNNVRNSFSTSTRTSQAGTVATTVGSSRTNSLVGSPPSPQVLKPAMEAARDATTAMHSSYRPMASYGGVSRRRSAVPTPNSRAGPVLPVINTSPAKPRHSVIVESPVTGPSFYIQASSSPPKRLIPSQSEPNLKGSLSTKDKHDSKMPSPPPIPAIPATASSDSQRPESLIADLPTPLTWSPSIRSSDRRTSLLQPAAYQPFGAQQEAAHPLEQNKAKRISFSMPLKVNPSGQHAQALPTYNNIRILQTNEPDAARKLPIVHTLTATADASKRVSISQVQPPHALTSQGPPRRSPSASPRLSLFPSATPPPTNGVPQPPRRSSSATALNMYTHAQAQAQAQAERQQQTQPQSVGRSLKGPTSMQVNSDPAPFLPSNRDSTGPTNVRAIPIRSMKPSRSASNVATLGPPSHSNAFKGMSLSTPTLLEEDDKDTPLRNRSVSPLPSEDNDKSTPLTSRAVSPMPSRPGSRSSVRRSVKPRSSLPELDLGIPVVGLGPPAPPPSAPLPLLPPASRPSSPIPMGSANLGIDAVAGLGIRVS